MVIYWITLLLAAIVCFILSNHFKYAPAGIYLLGCFAVTFMLGLHGWRYWITRKLETARTTLKEE